MGRRDDNLPSGSLSASSEAGVTLIELLIAASMMLVVAAATMALIGVSFHQTQNQYDRVVAVDNARNGLFEMTSEIRSAVALQSVSPQILDVLVAAPGDTTHPYHWVRFKCVGNATNSNGLGGTCSRQDKTINSGNDCANDGSGPGCVVILHGITPQGGDSFDEPCDNYTPGTNEEKHFCVKDNRTVQISVYVTPEDAQNPIEMRTAVTIRNCMTNQQVVVPCPT